MYQLGTVIIPNPKKFTRNIVEQSTEHLLMFGKTTKKIQNRKEQFILEYQFLTQTQIGAIISQYELNVVLPFRVNEGNLQIGPTDVFVDIQGLEYPPSGVQYRENMIIILTEVI